ncbi:MAG TPA: PcfB family protein [Candidatus Pullichristensenella stercorigallinarum]|uniref:PcfB family protein n=1 Tax=Candidatus Pullichristensenella stercorigallinarum TaxID=2840909 RepID=A0A9D0ZP78_9FIRM|nr:PcfB family protein [Candidatus Pullichristensenella stercorigallinarum]
MMNGGEAADQMVSYAFKGGEVVLRLTGDGAKHLAVYLANLLKQGGPSKGRTTLKRMIADGRELSVQRIDVSQIPYFNAQAKKYGVMFVAVRDTKAPDGKCDIMFRTEDAARVNRIFDRLAISEHPDVAHIKSDILRAKEGKNPMKARREASVSPSAPGSPGSAATGKSRASVRGQLRALREERPAAPAAAIKTPRGRPGKGR